MRKRLGIFLFVFSLAATWVPTRAAAPQQAGRAAAIRKPRLIIMLVIDQFRYDYLLRFRPEFVQGGFNLLLSGANFVNCRYDYATTATCPGHAALATGAYANLNGIIGNSWWAPALGKEVYCVADPDVQVVGAASGEGMSPRNLTASTFGDELRLASGLKSQVVAISWKDRAAIMLGGHLPSAVYWADPSTAHFITSTYYTSTLPGWVAQFNAQDPAKEYCGEPWRALPETPDVGGKMLHAAATGPGEPCPSRKFSEHLPSTPFANQLELNFATAAIQNDHLGQGPATDLLAISLSANDYIGHGYGPYSPEVADATLRTDRYLADFFKKVNQLVGLDNVWITLSADHGVAPTPAFILEHHLGPGRLDPKPVKAAVEQALAKAFGPGDWLANLGEFYIDLNHPALESHNISIAQAEEVAAHAAMSVPTIRAAFTRTQFLDGELPRTPLARKAANSYNPTRSGDVFLIPQPYAVINGSMTGTSHGTPWNYDAQVPLVFWGQEFKPGNYTMPAQPIDLASTLAAALGMTQPSDAQGQPLTNILK
ncbi:MAG: alkaline phosphatase family protein [Acidobacteria bacterium]|nr:MAG: alkaline phosphatase family protein [Acidobacteriota bacterium]